MSVFSAFSPVRSYLSASQTPDCQQSLALTTSPQYMAFPTGMVGRPGVTIEVTCDGGAGLAFIFSNAAVAALSYANGLPVLPGQSKLYGVPDGCPGLTVIGASAAGNIRFVIGTGG